MKWTRMHDGSYHAVGETYGVRTGYTVMRAFRSRTLWILYVNDQYHQADCPAGTSCAGAKLRAERHHIAACRASMAARAAAS